MSLTVNSDSVNWLPKLIQETMEVAQIITNSGLSLTTHRNQLNIKSILENISGAYLLYFYIFGGKAKSRDGCNLNTTKKTILATNKKDRDTFLAGDPKGGVDYSL